MWFSEPLQYCSGLRCSLGAAGVPTRSLLVSSVVSEGASLDCVVLLGHLLRRDRQTPLPPYGGQGGSGLLLLLGTDWATCWRPGAKLGWGLPIGLY